MNKINIVLILLLGLMHFSCENEYDLEVDMSNSTDPFLVITNDPVVIAETKVFDLSLITYTAYYEDVTINWTISGDDFESFSGSGVYEKMTGQKGDRTREVEIMIPEAVVPDGFTSVNGTLSFTAVTKSGESITSGDNVGDDANLSVTINKYIPLDRSVFIGEFTENDGSSAYTGVEVKEDPDDEFGLLISTKTWGNGEAQYKVVFNTVSETVSCPTQFIGYDYWDGASDDETSTGAVWFAASTDDTMIGEYDLGTGNFSVPVNMSLKNYPYDFGNSMITYTKE